MTQESAQAPWFAEAQYRALQAEVGDCLKGQARLEKFCVGGVVIALVWLSQNSDLYTGPANLVWFLPIVISLYGALKSNAIDVRLRVLGDYLHQIERRQIAVDMSNAQGGPDQSWQGYQAARGARRRALLGRFAWIAFVAITALASVTGFEGSWPIGDDDGDSEPTAAHVYSEQAREHLLPAVRAAEVSARVQ